MAHQAKASSSQAHQAKASEKYCCSVKNIKN
jgi:hypothetical protein